MVEKVALAKLAELELVRVRWGHGHEWNDVKRSLRELGMEILDDNTAPASPLRRRGRMRFGSTTVGSTASPAPRGWWQRRSLIEEDIEEDTIPPLGLDEVEWWGNKDIVGASPFDHIPQGADSDGSLSQVPTAKRKRVLFLTGECERD
jgi:hypothetical protein